MTASMESIMKLFKENQIFSNVCDKSDKMTTILTQINVILGNFDEKLSLENTWKSQVPNSRGRPSYGAALMMSLELLR